VSKKKGDAVASPFPIIGLKAGSVLVRQESADIKAARQAAAVIVIFMMLMIIFDRQGIQGGRLAGRFAGFDDRGIEICLRAQTKQYRVARPQIR
jgi:hypothetical protein